MSVTFQNSKGNRALAWRSAQTAHPFQLDDSVSGSVKERFGQAVGSFLDFRCLLEGFAWITSLSRTMQPRLSAKQFGAADRKSTCGFWFGCGWASWSSERGRRKETGAMSWRRRSQAGSFGAGAIAGRLTLNGRLKSRDKLTKLRTDPISGFPVNEQSRYQ